jgi:hypothetical protein
MLAANLTSATAGLDPQQFVTVRDVPIFRRHRLVLADGQVIDIGLEELQAIARRCNQRIEDTGDYAAVTIGHTSDPDQDAEQPETVGFAGPFRVGKFLDGDQSDWAILADLHIYRDRAEVLRKYPRRSAELWRDGPVDQWYLDPIALISDTPRLDLGLLYYARKPDGRLVAKYAAAAASPSATSVYLPEHTSASQTLQENKPMPGIISTIRQRMDQAAEDQYQKPGPEVPEELRPLWEAIMNTPAMQWVLRKMAEENQDQSPAPAGSEPSKVEYEGQPSDKVPPEKARQILQDGTAQGKPLTDAQRRMFQAAAHKDDYQAQEPEGETVKKENVIEPQKTDIQAALESLQAKAARLEQELAAERAKRVDAERYAKLQALRKRFAFDLDKEFERCRYSRMSEQQFQDHVQGVIPNYKELPVEVHVPHFDEVLFADTGRERYERNADGSVTRTRYGREVAVRAKELALRKGIPFEDALEQVSKGAS